MNDKEHDYGTMIDKCITDLAIKTGTGIVVGGLFSLLFKRKRWPVTLGAGIGIGMAYIACENRFRSSHIYQVSQAGSINRELASISESQNNVDNVNQSVENSVTS